MSLFNPLCPSSFSVIKAKYHFHHRLSSLYSRSIPVSAMCVEIFATYTCGHTVPIWLPCSVGVLYLCEKYQRQFRTRPLRCACTCPRKPATVSTVYGTELISSNDASPGSFSPTSSLDGTNFLGTRSRERRS